MWDLIVSVPDNCLSFFLPRDAIFNPIMYRGGGENKLSSGHVRIQINVNKPWMDLPVR